MGRRALKLKSDKFKKSRGGYSRWLLVSCEKCKTPVVIYQKDGPGILKRLYIDRIAAPKLDGKSLVCRKCKTVLGIQTIYQKENRLVYRLFVGAVGKRIISQNNLGKARATVGF